MSKLHPKQYGEVLAIDQQTTLQAGDSLAQLMSSIRSGQGRTRTVSPLGNTEVIPPRGNTEVIPPNLPPLKSDFATPTPPIRTTCSTPTIRTASTCARASRDPCATSSPALRVDMGKSRIVEWLSIITSVRAFRYGVELFSCWLFILVFFGAATSSIQRVWQ